MTKLTFEAYAYAAGAHARQTRKGTEVPYITHLMNVASTVLAHGGDEFETAAAFLHDTVEDQGGQARLGDVRERFGSRIAAIVEGCTDADTIPKPPWRPRKEAFIRHLETAEPSVLLVMAADKLDNLRSIMEDYRDVGEAIWSRFHAGREDQVWQFGALHDVLERGAVRFPEDKRPEFERLVRRIEGTRQELLRMLP